jgi:uncharacterized membrane protein YgcG
MLEERRSRTERFFYRGTAVYKNTESKIAPIAKNDTGARSFMLTEADKGMLTFPAQSQDVINKQMKELMDSNQKLQQTYQALQHHVGELLFRYEQSCSEKEDADGLWDAKLSLHLLNVQLPEQVHEQVAMMKDAWYGHAVKNTYPALVERYKAEDDARVLPGKLNKHLNVLDHTMLAELAEEAEVQRGLHIMNDTMNSKQKRKARDQGHGRQQSAQERKRLRKGDDDDLFSFRAKGFHSGRGGTGGGHAGRGGRGGHGGGSGGGHGGRGRGGQGRGAGAFAGAQGQSREPGAGSQEFSKKDCRFGDSCTKDDCDFWHPTNKSAPKNGKEASGSGAKKHFSKSKPFQRKR